MFDRYTDRSRCAIVLAQEHARAMRHQEIDVDHVLLGLAAEGGGVAFQALQKAGVTMDGIRLAVLAARPAGTEEVSGHVPFTGQVKKALELGLRESLKLGHNFIGTEHLLLGVLAYCEWRPESSCAKMLEACGVTPGNVRERVMGLLRGYEDIPAPAADDDARMADVAARLRELGRQIQERIDEALEILGASA